MKRITSLVITVLVIIAAALVASCGASSIAATPNAPADNGQDNGAAVENQFDVSQFPAFPLDEQAAEQGKGVSWLSHPNHLSPFASLYGGIDPGDPNCYLLQGYKHQYATFYKPDSIAVAIYKIPLGALEPDLLDMKVAAQIGAPTDTYYAAIANFSAMHWQFYGGYTAPSWDTDMTTLGYDFTGPAGNMYIALIALPGQSLHITDITLNFKDHEDPNGDDPTWWNVYGQAFNQYSVTPHAGYTVRFENLGTGVTYTTVTAADGRWGFNLPTGHYKFGIDSNEMLLDVSGPPSMIDYIYDVSGFGIKMDLDNTGKFIYQDDNAAYVGSVVPMPLITANGF